MTNPCIKTGFVFRPTERTQRLTGDLFAGADGALYVRGIPKVCIERGQSDPRPAHAVIESNREYLPDPESVGFLHLYGVQLLAVSDEFRAHIVEWYPWHADKLPTEGVAP